MTDYSVLANIAFDSYFDNTPVHIIMLIRQMQYQTFSAFVNIKYPELVVLALSKAQEYSGFDILRGEDITNYMLTFRETEVKEEVFRDFGIDQAMIL